MLRNYKPSFALWRTLKAGWSVVIMFPIVPQAKVGELSKAAPLVEELQTKLRSLEDTKGWLERCNNVFPLFPRPR